MTFAGHTHGGQVWFPVVRRLIVPSKFGEKYAIGHVVERGAGGVEKQMFVNPGTGISILPVRFGDRPEVSVIRVVGEEREFKLPITLCRQQNPSSYDSQDLAFLLEKAHVNRDQ